MNRVHPVHAALEGVMLSWSVNRAQANQRANLCALALYHAGLLQDDAQVEHGMIVMRPDPSLLLPCDRPQAPHIKQ